MSTIIDLWKKLRDWKTSLPAIIIFVFFTLRGSGVVIIPDSVQAAFTFAMLGIIGYFANGVDDISTTLPGVISASFAVVHFFGINLPTEIANPVAVIIVFVVGLMANGIDNVITTIPAVIPATVALLQCFGIVVPAYIITTITMVCGSVIGLFSMSRVQVQLVAPQGSQALA